MESTIRIYDGERLIEHCVPFDAACTIGKGINSTIRYEANWLGKRRFKSGHVQTHGMCSAPVSSTRIFPMKNGCIVRRGARCDCCFLRRAEKTF